MFQTRAQRFIALTLLSTFGMQVTPAIAQKSVTGVMPVTPVEAEKTEPDALARSPGSRVISLDLLQLGSWGPVKLKGGNGIRTLGFGVRQDEQVVAARLTVAYDYSPSLLEAMSYLKVSLNEKIAILEPLPKDRAIGTRREMAIDPSLFKDYNEIRLDFEGNISSSCSNPLQTSIWLNVNDPTKLELTVVPKSFVGDLKTLPAPFLDKADRTLNLPVVFGVNPSAGSLKAAGIVASWFGIQAGAKGARFTTHLGALPSGNAVVFVSGGEEVAGIRGSTAQSLSIQTHPNNPQAKLLVITGATEADILSSAKTLALLHKTLTGPSFKVLKETTAPARLPYDAPAWIRTDRPVKFGELARLEDLKTQGYFPEVIRVNYRVSPDVFAWKTNGAPLQLKYRATRLPEHKNSALALGINSSFIDTIPLNVKPEKATTAATASETVKTANNSLRELSTFIPAYGVTARDQLHFTYSADITQTNPCDLPPNNFVASIDAESTIDFSQFPKFAALPNLAYFAQMGFPFTRLADLAETSVVMPDRPSAEEISVYLTVMAKMGESTAYPVTNHKLIRATEIAAAANTDLIVIGSGQNQLLFNTWAKHLPIVFDNGARTIKEPVANWRPAFGWEQQDDKTKVGIAPGQMNIAGPGTFVAMMGFESPLKPQRSVVFFYADKPADLTRIEDSLVDPVRLAGISGDLVIVGEKSLQATRASHTYVVGDLAVTTQLRWLLSDHPIVVALGILLLAILIAALLYRPLKLLKLRFTKVET